MQGEAKEAAKITAEEKKAAKAGPPLSGLI